MYIIASLMILILLGADQNLFESDFSVFEDIDMISSGIFLYLLQVQMGFFLYFTTFMGSFCGIGRNNFSNAISIVISI